LQHEQISAPVFGDWKWTREQRIWDFHFTKNEEPESKIVQYFTVLFKKYPPILLVRKKPPTIAKKVYTMFYCNDIFIKNILFAFLDPKECIRVVLILYIRKRRYAILIPNNTFIPKYSCLVSFFHISKECIKVL
jgi:hypothetical protein